MKNKINIYLDDLRDCPKGFVLAKTIEEVKELMKLNNVEILSLDHDLGSDTKGNVLDTGYDLVKYLCEYMNEENFSVDKIYLHTDNPVGRDNMFETLKGAQRRDFINKSIEIYNYPYVKNKYTEK